jgi:hypothetical protein
VIEIAEGAGGPEALTELVARDQVARTFQQKREDLEALFLEVDPDARLPQLARPAIQFEDAESDRVRRPRLFRHAWSSAQKAVGGQRDPSTRGPAP